MDEAGGLHEVVADGRVLADMTPLEVIRDHGTLVGATLGWDRAIWETFGPLGPTPVFDDFPTAFRASLIGGIGYVGQPLLHYRMGGTSARPEGEAGRNYLHGFRIKDLRWHRSFWRAYLEALERVAPPDAEACRRLCEAKIAARGLRDRPRRDPLVAAAAAAAGERRAEPRPARPGLPARDRQVPRRAALPPPARRQGGAGRRRPAAADGVSADPAVAGDAGRRFRRWAEVLTSR